MGVASILPLAADGVCFAAARQPLLHDLSFALTARQRTVILGPNGSGKTLVLRLCHGLLQPTRGRLHWAVDDATARPRHAMVFERPLMLRRSVAANIAYPLALRGVPRGRRRAEVEQAMANTGLTHLADRPARVLSAGEQKRLALARAMACQPEVLFLDEPTGNLDPGASRAVEEIIGNIHQSGTKVVMTTHDLAQARRLADDILFLHHGRLLEQRAAQAFFARPRSQAARAFIAGDLLW
jgi:tungstate transport system ATP-binding protein